MRKAKCEPKKIHNANEWELLQLALLVLHGKILIIFWKIQISVLHLRHKNKDLSFWKICKYFHKNLEIHAEL